MPMGSPSAASFWTRLLLVSATNVRTISPLDEAFTTWLVQESVYWMVALIDSNAVQLSA